MKKKSWLKNGRNTDDSATEIVITLVLFTSWMYNDLFQCSLHNSVKFSIFSFWDPLTGKLKPWSGGSNFVYHVRSWCDFFHFTEGSARKHLYSSPNDTKVFLWQSDIFCWRFGNFLFLVWFVCARLVFLPPSSKFCRKSQ